MKYYVMSKDLYANGGRGWVSSLNQAWCFGGDYEAAEGHAATFRDSQAQTELRSTLSFREERGHRDARVVGFCEE